MIEIKKVQIGQVSLDITTVKNFIKVDYIEDDTLIEELIIESKDIIEDYLDRSLVNNAVSLIASKRESLVLPYGPVDKISSVADQDTGKDIEYEYDGLELTLEPTGTFIVTYTTKEDVPAGLRLAWLEAIAFLYDNRGDDNSFGVLSRINQNLQPYRRNSIWI